jgi:hypothetical protein
MSAEKPDYRLMIRDWSPGYLDTPEEDTLPPGATPDAKNAWFVNINPANAEAGAKLAKRPGSRMLNPTVMDASAKVDGLFEFRRSGASRELVAVCNGKVKVFDDVDTFVQVGVTAPFTPGNLAHARFHRDMAYIFDGTALQRYDGATLSDVGQAAPTAATNMSAVAPSGAGLTGTYEALYTYYSSTLVHESSVSPVTATQAVAGQARRHTRPTGSPGALYDFWRIYVRNVSTNETKFGLVLEVPIATVTQDEEVADTAVIRNNLAPANGVNDPPPGAFKLLVEWQGVWIGVLANSSEYAASKHGEIESWRPRDVFPVSKGDGDDLTGVKLFGEEIWLQKQHATWRLVGDRVPFQLKSVHTSYGGVGALSGQEVDGYFYDWDRERGPYRTDGQVWTSLADARVRDMIDAANRDTLSDIRCLHIEGKGLVGWSFARTGSTRKRTTLWYCYLTESWLPPWTGLEYGSLAAYTNPNGVTGYYMGDYWGRVFELLSGDREGVPAASVTANLTGTVTAATSGTVTCAAASFYNTGSGLAGLPVAAVSPAGVWQWRRIASNTGQVVTLDTTNDAPWTTVPDAGWTIYVGAIEWYHWLPWFDFGHPEYMKQLHYLFLQSKVTSESHTISVNARFNDDEGITSSVSYSFPTGSATGVWGTGIWGTSLWGFTSRRMRKKRIDRSAFTVQFQLSNFYPDQPVTITALGITADKLIEDLVASE